MTDSSLGCRREKHAGGLRATAALQLVTTPDPPPIHYSWRARRKNAHLHTPVCSSGARGPRAKRFLFFLTRNGRPLGSTTSVTVVNA